MHGTELREQRAPGVSPLGSPASGFSADRIRASGHAAAFLVSLCPGPVARNGLSLACNGYRSRGFHSRVNVPGLLLRSLRRRSLTRSAFRSTAGTGLPRPGCFPAWARCRIPTALDPLFLRSPLPRTDFSFPAGSKRSTGSSTDQSTFRSRPISTRSPLPFFYC